MSELFLFTIFFFMQQQQKDVCPREKHTYSSRVRIPNWDQTVYFVVWSNLTKFAIKTHKGCGKV